MSVGLLDKTRKLQNQLKLFNSSEELFDNISETISNLTDSQTVFIDTKGYILTNKYKNSLLDLSQTFFNDNHINNRLLNFVSTKENVKLLDLGFKEEKFNNVYGLIVPAYNGRQRLGTFFLCRPDELYNIDDIIVAEYATTIIGLEMSKMFALEFCENASMKEAAVAALNNLSPLEIEAARCLYSEMKLGKDIIIVSNISNKAKITRSVIVNAIKKLDSASIIESKSLGAKGTYINILNNFFFDLI